MALFNKKIFFWFFVVTVFAILVFLNFRNNNLSHQEEVLSKVGSLKLDLSDLKKYQSSVLGIQFQYKSRLRIIDHGDEIVLTGLFAQKSDFDESGIFFRQHENNNKFGPMLWWWKNEFWQYGVNSIFQLTKKEIVINGQKYYIVASGGKWKGDPFISAFTSCGNKICEVSSRTNNLYLGDENYYIALLTLIGYRENSDYSDETKNWKVYRNNKFGYEISYPEYYSALAPERLNMPATGDDPYVKSGPFEIRGLFCTFPGEDISLEEYTGRQSLFEKNIKYINNDGKEYMAESALMPGLPKLTTYNSYGEYAETVYVKRGRILYVISQLKNNSKASENVFNKVIESFKLLPLENELELTSQVACGFKNAGGNFYKNNYVVQYLADRSLGFNDQFRLPGVNAKTFEFIGGDYGKDSAYVYFRNQKMEGADLESFHFISGNKAVDKNNKYVEGIEESLWQKLKAENF